jgi:hypothetical protein
MKRGIIIIIIIIIIILSVLLLSSCNKSVDESHWQAVISKNKAATLQDVFLQNGSEILIDIVSSKDEVKISNFNKTKANQIASYFQDKFNIDITKEFIDNPEGIVILGLFYAKKEQLDAKSLIMSTSTNNVMKSSDENMDCFLTAVGDFIGLTQARSIWKSIVMGASEQTEIAAVKLIGRRVASIISVATMVYSTGSCLDWW